MWIKISPRVTLEYPIPDSWINVPNIDGLITTETSLKKEIYAERYLESDYYVKLIQTDELFNPQNPEGV
jgi:hypothetical protein